MPGQENMQMKSDMTARLVIIRKEEKSEFAVRRGLGFQAIGARSEWCNNLSVN
jgi:hypothetical protein